MSDQRNDDEFERRLDEVAESLRDVADQISALRDYVPRSPAEGGEADAESTRAPSAESDASPELAHAPTPEQASQPDAREPDEEQPADESGAPVSSAPVSVEETEGQIPTPEYESEPVPKQATGAKEAPVDAGQQHPKGPDRASSARGTPAYNPSSPERNEAPSGADRSARSDSGAQRDAGSESDAEPRGSTGSVGNAGPRDDRRPSASTGPRGPADHQTGTNTSPDDGPRRAAQAGRGTATAASSPHSAGDATADEESEPGVGFRVENWIDKIGIALVLLGVAFLYKLSVEMGLITPPIKVFLGGIVSTALLGVGLKIRDDRRGLAQIMMGGASAGFYLTVFAASQIYELIGDPMALGATLAVAAGTFGLAIREDTPALTVVGAIGAFATPFFLEASNAGQLLAFNAIIVAGMTAVYVYKGWTALLLTYATGAWVVVLYAVALQLDDAFGVGADPTLWADLLSQVGLTIAWLATGVVPTVRAWLLDRESEELELESGGLDTLLIFGLALMGPVLYQVAAHILWEWSDVGWAAFDVAWAIAAALLAARLAGEGSELFSGAFRFVALMFGTLALFEFFDGAWLPTALAIEGAAVCYMGRRLDDNLLRGIGHVLLAGTSVVLLTTLDFAGDLRMAFFNGEFLRACITIAAIVAVSVDEDNEIFVLGYRYMAHGLILLVVLDQSTSMEHGQLICTAIWGAYAIGVLVAGTIVDSRQTTLVGFLTIVLTATKLIAFDMADTETIWRVAVFIGFGGALLLTSYLVPGLAGGDSRRDGPGAGDADGSGADESGVDESGAGGSGGEDASTEPDEGQSTSD